jgi:hypothetical protein
MTLLALALILIGWALLREAHLAPYRQREREPLDAERAAECQAREDDRVARGGIPLGVDWR